MVQSNIEWLNREANGLWNRQKVQCNVEWFNQDWSGGTAKQLVLREIKWFRMTYNSWCQNDQKYKSEIDKSRMELSRPPGVWHNVLYP